MRMAMYINYPLRSLFKGKLRTLLAMLCIALGVMALVALQSVSSMVQASFNVNARSVNGGDITIQANSLPFTANDLTYFDSLKQAGTIQNYTPGLLLSGELNLHDWAKQSIIIYVVDPTRFPLVGTPELTNPSHTTFAKSLAQNKVIASQAFIDLYHKRVGDSFDMHTSGNVTLHMKLGAIATNSGVFVPSLGRGALVLSLDAYQQMVPNSAQPVLYNFINVTTANPTHTTKAVQVLQNHFPDASMRLPSDTLQQVQGTIDTLQKFLQIAGILALFICGVGIMNTMQVLLARRKLEIAMLKATGYRRSTLILIFGLETALLGLFGSIIGTGAGIAITSLVNKFVSQLTNIEIPFVLNPLIIGGGVAAGTLIALIFGLLPILQNAGVRPLNVLRDLPEEKKGGKVLVTWSMLFLLSLVLCGLATIILNNDVLYGVIVVYGGCLFLGLLSLICGIAVFLIARWPLPERFGLGHLFLLILISLLVAAVPFLVLPEVSILLLVVSLLGSLIILTRPIWRAHVKMALRNLDRRRGRTVAIMVVMFVGFFAISLILVLSQNLREAINKPRTLNFNIATITTGDDTANLQQTLGTIPGLSKTLQFPIARTSPIMVNNQPVSSLFTLKDRSSQGAYQAFTGLFSSAEGYDVATGKFPDTQNYQITGRTLNASDAGTNNVLVDSQLKNLPGVHLQLGDHITLVNFDQSVQQDVTIVGFFQDPVVPTQTHWAPIWAPLETVNTLQSTNSAEQVFLMHIDQKKVNTAIDHIGAVAPNAQVQDLANDNRDFFNQLLGNLLSVLTVVASFSMLIGVAIIANSVALAMFERKRELGILRSVGYKRRTLLNDVLLENALIGGVSALLAIILVTLVANPIGSFFLNDLFRVSNVHYGINSTVAIGLILGGTLLTMVVASMVAWRALSIRPLEVLRYE
jgi:putative ABC transport system permease protein